jgi:hypothetical protein
MQMREETYQTLGALASQVAGFYEAAAALPAWAAALVGDLPSMPNQHLRLLLRHIIIPLVKACPPVHRSVHLPETAASFFLIKFSIPTTCQALCMCSLVYSRRTKKVVMRRPRVLHPQ